MYVDSFDSKEKMRKLVDFLNYHTKLYDAGHPEISDKEWDTNYFELQRLEEAMGFTFADSPTQKINYDIINKLNKVTHSHPMLSLDKTKSLEDIKSFLGDKPFIAMPKLDGLTCSLTYQNGKLVKAETRGNGLIGEDILHNALHVANIPNTINYKDELIVDGEIICTYENFKSFENEYKNPRNFASGSIRLLDSNECAKRNLSFIAWDEIGGEGKTLDYKFVHLIVLGFDTVFWYMYGNLEKIIEDIKESSKEYGYPIDGVVFKYNKISDYEAAGRTDHHFKGGLALKFYDEEYETTLQDIEWTMGRTGQLTPVAIFNPIDIDGTEVSRASLHNLTIMKELFNGMPKLNQGIYVYKANQIIPQISRVEEYPEGCEFKPPVVCPICGKPTEIRKDYDSEVLYCSNPNCEGKLLNRFEHFLGKKGLDIKGISEATIEKLMDWGWLNTYKDIFLLKNYKNEWVNKSGFGIASVDKILSAIEDARNTTLDKVIAAAGIPEIGTKVAKDLARHYKTWADFRTETNFFQYDGIGEIMERNIIAFDYNDLLLDETINEFLNINEIEENKNENEKIKDKVFCITGKLMHFKNRDALIADIESKGGKVVSAMSSKVNYLINNDVTSTSAKNKAAKSANIPILSEEDYLEL